MGWLVELRKGSLWRITISHPQVKITGWLGSSDYIPLYSESKLNPVLRSESLLLRVQSCKVYEVEPGAESGPYDYAKPLVMMWKLNCFALGTPKTFYMEENSPLMTKKWGTPEISSMKNL
ncbi:hypothetical protein K435DRAFT_799564 [Dendrothele bispora CBS 962.96]|uniref:Uncharacterized protein n=1 Tax=Dendrothele bispora (strain CBS 962.96) TaxID=1314807 RepID=A0A4S8LVB1_DENBC|nr:hypothetical protein K435DRAFT_799564 [Dendrothele bispora CBS 962.96]